MPPTEETLAVMQQVVAGNAELTARKDAFCGYTAVHWAAKHGSSEMLALSFNDHVDINARTRGGYTALHIACLHGHHVLQAKLRELGQPLLAGLAATCLPAPVPPPRAENWLVQQQPPCFNDVCLW